MKLSYSEEYDEVNVKDDTQVGVTLHALDCKLLFNEVEELESGDTIYFCKTLGVHKAKRSYTIVKYVPRGDDSPLFRFDLKQFDLFKHEVITHFSQYF